MPSLNRPSPITVWPESSNERKTRFRNQFNLNLPFSAHATSAEDIFNKISDFANDIKNKLTGDGARLSTVGFPAVLAAAFVAFIFAQL